MIPIYLVSLKQDHVRRARLQAQFGHVWDWFEVVSAVDGNNLPTNLPPQCHCNRRKPLSPREVAVAASHVAVWRNFIASGAKSCIVFEDDIIGSIDLVINAIRLMEMLPSGAFALLGGQQGLRNRRFVYGRRLQDASITHWLIPRPSWRFISRACSYGLTLSCAHNLLAIQERCLDRADNWYRLLRYVDSVYMANLFAHPADLSASHIEPDRLAANARPLYKRVIADGIAYACTNAIVKSIWPTVARYQGLQRVLDGAIS